MERLKELVIEWRNAIKAIDEQKAQGVFETEAEIMVGINRVAAAQNELIKYADEELKQ